MACGGGEDADTGFACPAPTFDHDGDPQTTCLPWSDCAPGQFVAEDGTATNDRMCAPCTDGTLSTEQNAAQCSAWTECGPGYVELAPGTAASNPTCRVESWGRQFGTASFDDGNAVAVTASGDVVVVGDVRGALPGQTGYGNYDAFVRLYDAGGTERWTQQFGTDATDDATDVQTDGNKIVVAGSVFGALPGETFGGSGDVYVRTFDTSGQLVDTIQFGGATNDQATGVALFDGRIIVAGSTDGALADQTHAGDWDAFVASFDQNGELVWLKQFGTSALDVSRGITVDADGNIYMIGATAGAFPTHTNSGDWDAFVRSYDRDGNHRFTLQFGANGTDDALGVTVRGSHLVITGVVRGTQFHEPISGAGDAFVRLYSLNGELGWTHQFGTTGADVAWTAVGTPDGFAVMGRVGGVLPGQSADGEDVFLRHLDLAGIHLGTLQFGTSSRDEAHDMAITPTGDAFVAVGTTWGAVTSDPNLGESDIWVSRMYR